MDKEATLDAVESSLDVIEETVDTVKRVSPGSFNMNGMTKRQQITILAATAVVSAAAGGGLTYILTKKRLRTKYEELADREIESAKQFYKRLHKEGDAEHEVLTPQQIFEKRHGKDAAEAIRAYQGEPLEKIAESPVDPEESAAYLEQIEGRVIEQVKAHSISLDAEPNAFGETVNLFETRSDDPEMEGWDYQTELARRSGDKPYIITHDEFFESDKDYDQVQLTYYEGDDVLVDDQDVPVQNTDATVGDDNLTRFGHGSKDKNIVYIRNDKSEMDIEVVRHEGEYTKHVLGFIEHSHKPGKFRGHDD